MALGWILLIIVAVFVLYFIVAYNRLVSYKHRINNAWSQIDVQLKRRYDLIPNLINTVKGYVKHEKGTLKELTDARTRLMSGSMAEKAKASNQITDALKTIFAVAENYPNLKASDNFKMLQEELSGTESKIAYARQFYNDNVLSLNQSLESFPTNIVGNFFGFKPREYFKVSETETKPIKVDF
ncbi:MAG: LemA family protein [Candidatus Woesearchaeota archaeon]|nr:LemA family protein [Candidatus Woesearchaeota archaeon]